MKLAIAVSAFAVAASAFAQDMPVPKMFKGMQGQEKGQWKMEMLEGPGRAGKGGMTITICTDNLMNQATGRDKPKTESSCKNKLLKDTADEAVVEHECQDRKSTITMKREGNSTLMTMESTGPKGPQTMKMRATRLGPCREGQGAVTLDKDSEQCRKIRAQAAKMDPAKQCARQTDKEACEKKVRDAAAQLSSMCN